MVIEISYHRGWHFLWLEMDSLMVTLTFKNSFMITWHLRIIFLNCVKLTKNMSFIMSHIYQEGNQCIDGVTNIDLHAYMVLLSIDYI